MGMRRDSRIAATIYNHITVVPVMPLELSVKTGKWWKEKKVSFANFTVDQSMALTRALRQEQ